MTEHIEQSLTFEWWCLQYPSYAKCFIAIPNGSHLAGTEAQRCAQSAKLKKEGMKRGASDILIAVPCGRYHGLWIEMKDKGKTKCSVRKDQWDHMELMQKMGYFATWCAGFVQAKKCINNYMSLI